MNTLWLIDCLTYFSADTAESVSKHEDKEHKTEKVEKAALAEDKGAKITNATNSKSM